MSSRSGEADRSSRSGRARVLVPAGIAVGSVLLTGCYGSVRSASSSEQTSASPATQPTATSVGEALNDFRDMFYKQRKADIMMGFCMAWRNQGQTITVTYDPGLIAWKEHGQLVTAPVFASTTNAKQNGDVTLLNGPETGDPDTITLVFDQSSIRSPRLRRVLSPQLVQGADGDTYHTDVSDTGWPLINTRLVDGDFTAQHVSEVCMTLRNDTPLAGGDQA